MIDVYHSVTGDGINSSVAAILFSEFMLQCLYFININIFFTCSRSYEKEISKNILFDNTCFKNSLKLSVVMIILLFWKYNALFLKLSYLFNELIIAVIGVFIDDTVLNSVHKIVIHCFYIVLIEKCRIVFLNFFCRIYCQA